jgi:16S rRNA C967 or C1407 C5-methylase (RsmB/RsmF family)
LALTNTVSKIFLNQKSEGILHYMTPPNETDDYIDISRELVKRYDYADSLLNHWIHSFGLDKTLKILEDLRNPFDTIWVQVNTSRIDYDSLFTIFEEMEYNVQKHHLFEDFLEVKVEKRDFNIEDSDIPSVIVDIESSSNISLGKDVQTASVIKQDKFSSGDKVKVIDHTGSIIALGEAQVNSKEIPTLTQMTVVKVTDSPGFVPPLTEMSVYRRGYFNVLTPVQAIGVKSLYLDKLDNVLVISNDRGEVAGYIAELTNHKTPITVLAQNELQVKAITRQIKRLNTKAIRLLHVPFLTFLKEMHEMEYSSVYLGLPNSRTAEKPAFSSNLSAGRLREMVKDQTDIITHLYRCLHENASITYTTHSLDYLENEGMFKKILEKAYYESQSFPEELRILQSKKVLKSRDVPTIDTRSIDLDLKNSTIFLDPIETKNVGGFLAKFKFKKKTK